MTRRRLVPGLPTPHPLGPQLPAVYAEDDTAQRITEALDEVLAPVLAVLDSLPAYFDPRLAPEDFGELLAAWVGADGPAAVPGAVRGYAARGTAAGLADAVRQAFGVAAEVEESGATVWSTTPGTPLPGSPEPLLTVRLRTADPTAVDLPAVEAFVARNRPAHLPFTVVQAPALGDPP